MLELYLKKVQARNKKKYATSDVRSSSVQVGCIRTVGIIGTTTEPRIQPLARAPSLKWKHIKMLVTYETSII